jgi:hypothetical protein
VADPLDIAGFGAVVGDDMPFLMELAILDSRIAMLSRKRHIRKHVLHWKDLSRDTIGSEKADGGEHECRPKKQDLRCNRSGTQHRTIHSRALRQFGSEDCHD